MFGLPTYSVAAPSETFVNLGAKVQGTSTREDKHPVKSHFYSFKPLRAKIEEHLHDALLNSGAEVTFTVGVPDLQAQEALASSYVGVVFAAEANEDSVKAVVTGHLALQFRPASASSYVSVQFLNVRFTCPADWHTTMSVDISALTEETATLLLCKLRDTVGRIACFTVESSCRLLYDSEVTEPVMKILSEFHVNQAPTKVDGGNRLNVPHRQVLRISVRQPHDLPGCSGLPLPA
jgi:hypothetical protein